MHQLDERLRPTAWRSSLKVNATSKLWIILYSEESLLPRGERWIIDPMFEGAQDANSHRRMMALLAAPRWGLPVTPRDARCNCHLPPGHDQCTTTVVGTAERPGVLEVRAIQRRGDRLARIQEDHPAFYAAQKQLLLNVPPWVDRWLERSGSPALDVSDRGRW
ncbi:hypothetical protein ACFYOI_36760 [Streptomyces microflavus]|uniref:hypothetical protein n=1 Tax=Streptomyces microflavus TaxID=1919 RepID=UPI0033B184AB